jgi:hypothetical protein
MAEPREIYDLEPDEPEESQAAHRARDGARSNDDSRERDGGSSSESSGDSTGDGQAKPSSKDASKRAKIDAPRLLDDVDDDADLTHDPEVEAALKPTMAARLGKALSLEPKPGDNRPVFVKSGLGSARIWGVLGGVLALAAVITAVVTAQQAS